MKRTVILFLLFLSFCNAANSQLSFATRVLKDSLFIPWEIIYGPDNHLWFTQKNGFICRMDTAGIRLDTLYHEPGTVTIKESGMLGMALHPDFATQPYVYVIWEYAVPSGIIHQRVSRYTWDAGANTLTAPYIVMDTSRGFWFHNGSRLVIVGDKLFITVGDAADSSNPQNLHSLNGKILRINLDGSIPADNPIAGNPIWTWGHRNPQGLVYANNILYSSEHGPETDDEINIIMKGRNYGWPWVSGYCDRPEEMTFCHDSNVVQPIHAWTPTIAPCGIDFYHHPMFPSLDNSLILTTLKDQHLYQLKLNDTHDAITSVSIINGFNYGRLRDICISPEGKIFATTSNSNPNDTGKKVDRIIVMYDPGFSYLTAPMVLFPNPSSDYVNIMVPSPCMRISYKLTGMDGRKNGEGSMPCGNPRINISTLPPGIYDLAVTTDYGKTYTGTILRK